MRLCRLALLLSSCALPMSLPAAEQPIPAGLQTISERSLQGHLTFLASDLLEGRDTPSRGLDIAGEYIAAQFRRAGLEPAAQGSYFQVAPFVKAEPDVTGFQMTVKLPGGETVQVPVDDVTLQPGAAVTLTDAAVVVVDSPEAAGKLKANDVQGKVVALKLEREPAGRMAFNQALRQLQNLKPAMLLVVDNSKGPRMPMRGAILREASAPANLAAPYLIVRTAALQPLLKSKNDATVSVHLNAAKETPVSVRNVAGILRGSDPALKDTYILVTAHYDHIGVTSEGTDHIFNGANDDGSGTVSVIEIADALAHLPEKPKRSILFMTYFGEEKGLLGSRYFGAHPLVPLTQIVADMNLEQVGRTDSNEGSHKNLLAVTGRTFSDVTKVIGEAAKLTGQRLEQEDKNSDAFFSRSDNQALADQGIPAHTVCVAYEFPDYHKVGDSADKIDYANMARTDRTIAIAVWMIAENPQAPKWNASEPKAAKYLDAYKKLHATATSPGQE